MVSTANLIPLQSPLRGTAQHKLGEAGLLPAAPGRGRGRGGRRTLLELSVPLTAWLSRGETCLKAPIDSKLAGSEKLDCHPSLLAGDIVQVQ